MLYLSQMLGKTVLDGNGEEVGTIYDLAIATGEIFPCITSLAFKGPNNTPFMISWRKYVTSFDDDVIRLNVPWADIRFSYLQPDEVLLARDLMNKQIVDTQGLKVVRVNDLKLSEANSRLRLLGAEVGFRGVLRGISPALERFVVKVAAAFKHPLEENIIAWNYMELLERDLSQVKLSVTHRRLNELHPADVADILERLDPQQRAKVFDQLDANTAAETISELEDEFQADVIEDLPTNRASVLLANMDPDDAADIIGDLPYEKAEQLLRLMGVEEQISIRSLLGYKENTAGGIMTTEYFALDEATTVGEAIEELRALDEDHESVSYVYTTNEGILTGVLSLRTLVLAKNDTPLGDLAFRDLVTAYPDEDQEEIAENMSKYALLAMPVVDESGKLLGIVTVDDAIEVLEEEHDEDIQLISGMTTTVDGASAFHVLKRFFRREAWIIIWILLSLIVVGANGFSLFSFALLLMPVVLFTADEVGLFAINSLVEYEDAGENAPSPLGRFGRDAVVGLVLSVVLVLLAAMLIGVANSSDVDNSSYIAIFNGIATYLPATGIVIFLTLLTRAPITAWLKKRVSDDKEISTFGVSVGLMIGAGLLHILACLITLIINNTPLA